MSVVTPNIVSFYNNNSSMEQFLVNKSVLFLAPSFFNYEKEVVSELQKAEAKVSYLNDDPSAFFLFLKGVFEKIHLRTEWMIRCFENRIKRKISGERYDYILVICGWAITSRLCSILRHDNLLLNGRMFLYYWDSIHLLGDDVRRWDYFDRIFTFDRNDYEANPQKLFFLPLFYINEYSKPHEKSKRNIDLFTIGSFKFNRYFEIEEIKRNNPNINICSYMFEKRWLIRLYKVFRPKYKAIDLKNISYKKLSPDEIISFYKRSNAILDIPRAGQNGLTMRTFECLGMEKKMVTTNQNVKYYDFYSSENIYVMNSETCELPGKKWFQNGYVSIPQEIYKKYSIDSWIKKIFIYE